MKTLQKIKMALIAIACIGIAVACQKEETDAAGGSSDTQLVGSWRIASIMQDSTDLSYMLPDSVQITLNNGGNGTIKMGALAYPFSWAASSDSLTVTVGQESIHCAIASLSANECIVRSSDMTFPIIGRIQGTVTITLLRIGGGSNPTPNPSDTTYHPGTDTTYHPGTDTTYHPGTDTTYHPITDSTGGNNYSTMILGTWQISHMTLDSANVTSQLGTVKLSFYSNGTGLINNNGVTENNDYGWSLNGNVLTITPRGGSFNYTILYMSSSSCTVSGTMAPGIYQTGAVQFTMNKLN